MPQPVGWLAETKENFLINDFQPAPTLFQTCEAGSEPALSKMMEKSIVWVKEDEILWLFIRAGQRLFQSELW